MSTCETDYLEMCNRLFQKSKISGNINWNGCGTETGLETDVSAFWKFHVSLSHYIYWLHFNLIFQSCINWNGCVTETGLDIEMDVVWKFQFHISLSHYIY